MNYVAWEFPPRRRPQPVSRNACPASGGPP
jgi:hypothetical protein